MYANILGFHIWIPHEEIGDQYVTKFRYMINLYCLAIQAGFYSHVVECRTLSPADRVRSPVG